MTCIFKNVTFPVEDPTAGEDAFDVDVLFSERRTDDQEDEITDYLPADSPLRFVREGNIAAYGSG